jgi:hypothetical protein
MSNLSEEEVYIGTKLFLKKNMFSIIGGQPPRGVDHLPVIEIKSGTNLEKGSKDAYKPDLIAYKNGIFYIIECKPSYNEMDFRKIQDVFSSVDRIKSLFLELTQRRIFQKLNYNKELDNFQNSLKGVLAYSGNYFNNELIGHIVVEDYKGKGLMYNLE